MTEMNVKSIDETEVEETMRFHKSLQVHI